ncbi:MAG TPA: porin, partial [Stellaceae bacterium]
GPVGVQTVGGSFPRSFLIPGTDTSIRVGGAITVNVMYFFNGGNPNQTTNTTTNFGNNGALNSAPLHVHFAPAVAGVFPKATNAARSRSGSITFISPQQSKVNFETRTPTAWGESRTFMEFDWANGNQFVPGNNAGLSTDNLVPRLRFAYATLGGLLGGQANSNFADPDASTDNINFGGNVGDPGVTRITQIRYTMPLAGWGIPGAWSVSAEAPETDGWTMAGQFASDATCGVGLTGCGVAGGVNPFKSPAPDLTMAWYIPQPWGHMDFSAVLRPTLEIKDGAFIDRQYTGYGVHFSGDVKPGWFGWARDDITWQFVYGDGIGRYMGGNSTDFALVTNYPAAPAPASAAAAANIISKSTIMWGGNAGYQHRWTPTLRSNISAGILHHDISNVGNVAAGFVCVARSAAALAGTGGCGTNKELISTELNLIWNPVPFADIGSSISTATGWSSAI